MKGARLLILVLVLLALASVPTAAAPQAGPCAPSAAYDPACDVNHDNQITITDIQLTAGHWNQSGPWVSDNQHDHLGQLWSDGTVPLRLAGAYGDPWFAPLVLANTAGAGLRIASAAGSGVFVSNAGTNGFEVDTAGGDGLWVHSAGAHGVNVSDAGNDGVRVNYAAGNGVFVDTVDLNGIYVSESTLDGMFVLTAGANGVRVHSAALDGVVVTAAGGDGVDVVAAVDNGIEATGAHRAAYLEGDVEITGTCIGCLIAQMAVNTGNDSLQPGDVVAVDGIADSPFDNQPILLQVRRAAPGSALLGVVRGRAEPYTSQEDNSTTLVPRAGLPAAPGDYLSVVIYGPMQVAAAGDVEKGQRVTWADAGVRAMRRVTVDGVTLDEGGSSLGLALAPAADGFVWVLVNPQ